MPQMGESIAEGTIVRWIKKVGDPVDRDEPLFEITTDKVDAEIPSPAAGVLTEITVKEGETVSVNSVVGTIRSAGRGGRRRRRAERPLRRARLRGPARRRLRPRRSRRATASPPPQRPPPGDRRDGGPAPPCRPQRRQARRRSAPPEVVAARPPDRARAQRRHRADSRAPASAVASRSTTSWSIWAGIRVRDRGSGPRSGDQEAGPSRAPAPDARSATRRIAGPRSSRSR